VASTIISSVLNYGAKAAVVVSSVQQAQQAKKSSKAQQRLAEIRNERQRREAVRKARVARAQVVSRGQQSGGDLGSSSVQGGTGSVGAQLGANLSFLDQSTAAQSSIFEASAASASAASLGQVAGTIGQNREKIQAASSSIFNK